MLEISTLTNITGGSEEWTKYLEKLAIGYINSFLSYNIEDHENIFESDNLPGSIYLPQRPITSITKIEVNNGTIFDEDFEEYTDGKKIVGTAGKLLTETYISKPVKITYRSWFLPYIAEDTENNIELQNTNCPADIEAAIVFLVKYYNNNAKATGQGDIKSELVDGDKIEFVPPNNPATDKHIVNLLSNYIHYDVVT